MLKNVFNASNTHTPSSLHDFLLILLFILFILFLILILLFLIIMIINGINSSSIILLFYICSYSDKYLWKRKREVVANIVQKNILDTFPIRSPKQLCHCASIQKHLSSSGPYEHKGCQLCWPVPNWVVPDADSDPAGIGFKNSKISTFLFRKKIIHS